MSRILRTSVMSGTPSSRSGSLVSKVAQSTGSTAFLLAEGVMRPRSGVPPCTMRLDMEVRGTETRGIEGNRGEKSRNVRDRVPGLYRRRMALTGGEVVRTCRG